MEKQEFLRLLEKHQRGETDETEELMLKNYLQSFQEENAITDIKLPELQHSEDKVFGRLKMNIDPEAGRDDVPVRKIYPRVYGWMVAAAVAIVSLGVLWYMADNRQDPLPQQEASRNIIADSPGVNKATLTLSNGRKVELNADSVQLFSDNGVQISNQEGVISYPNADMAVLNTMSTPRGAQFKLMLADSTMVWLNAQSSITYPTAFNESERRVAVTGEVYFEVKKNAAKPFKVEAQGIKVEVLGTHFNLMAYAEEKDIITTLIEGKVLVTHAQSSVQLAPNQQARLQKSDQHLKLIKNVDTDEATAWLRGEMNFDNADIQSVMMQVSRWYDIDVKYEIDDNEVMISGKIFRRYTLQQVLEILEATHKVKFITNGKEIIVKTING